MRKIPLSLLPAIFLPAALAVGCASAPIAARGAGAPGGGSGGGAAAALAAPDRSYLADAAAEGMAEVKFARLAAERSHNSEIQDLARAMLADYDATNTALHDVATAKNVALPADLDGAERRDYWQLDRLTDRDFDRYYVNMVADYEIKDVRRCRHEMKSTGDTDLHGFAAVHLRVFEHERDRAEELVGHFGHGRTYGGDDAQ